MESLLFLVPAVATAALGGALFLPIRDGRAGRKATVDGRAPLQADFRAIENANAPDGISEADEAPGTPTTIVTQTAAAAEVSGAPENSEHTDTRATRAIDDAPLSSASNEAPNARAGDFEPTAFLRRVARRLRSRPAETIVEAHDALPEVVSERSFADELASLLPVARDGAPALQATISIVTPINSDHGPVRDIDRSHEAISIVASGSKHPPTFTPDHAHRVDDAAESVTHDVPATVVRTARVVPLTRLPLRHRSTEITWPALASPPQRFATIDERHAFLRARAADPQLVDDIALARAFREETPEGRALALAALRRSNASREAIETFAEALGTGSDDERALAIDALGEVGARDELARGVGDRIDAIAAKAALAYVGTTARDDYRVALSPLIDDTRIETILALLAGVVE